MKTYPKQRHTFPQNDECNPEKEIRALVYNGIHDPVEPYANYIIEDWQGELAAEGGRYYLQLENQQFQSDALDLLELLLFKWMENEGVKPLGRFDLVLHDESLGVTEPCVWDRNRNCAVFTINPPYAQLICLETRDCAGFTQLVEWMNSIDEDALRSEGIE